MYEKQVYNNTKVSQNMKSEIKDNALVISLSGRIDSSNAEATEAELNSLLSGETEKDIVFDLEQLQYISSAGLRIILRVRKNHPSLRLINASSEVYDIFDMTGFTEMIPVEKAYRRLSVEGCEVIGQGANGKVYRLDPDTIIKVYMNPDSLPDIHRERELARKAFVLGIPTAIPYDVVKVGDGYGSVFELLNAKSFAKLIKAEPENLDRYVGLYVDLMKKIHSTEVKPGDMPSMKDVAVKWATMAATRLPETEGSKLVRLVNDVPDDLHMMHGDYHVKNVMLQNGETLLIDMDTLCYGNPVFDLGSMYNAYLGFSLVDHTVCENFIGLPYDTCREIFEKSLALYVGTDDPAKLGEITDKVQLVGLMRLFRRLINRHKEDAPEFEPYRERIIELLGRVDSLII